MTEGGDEQPAGDAIVKGEVSISDILGLGKAAEKLTPVAQKVVEAVAGGLGKVYEPASIYLNSRAQNLADRHNALADAKAYLDIRTRSPAVLEAMRQRILGIEYRRQENILAAEAVAIALAQELPHRAEGLRDIHPDFTVQWLEGVKDVSETKLRDAWAKLLAHAPFEQDGRVPKPVVDFLEQLDGPLAGELRNVYEAHIANEGYLPYSFHIRKLAYEIGIAEVATSQQMSLMDDWILISAPSGFRYQKIGLRALMLAQLVISPLSPSPPSLLPDLRGWIRDKAIKSDETFSISVGAWSQYVSFRLLNEEETEGTAATVEAVEKMSNDAGHASELRSSLLTEAEAGRLKYVRG